MENLIFNNTQRWYLNYLAVAALIVCYFTSRAGLSIATIILFALALINIDWQQNLKSLLADKGILAIGGIFVLYLLGVFYSTDQSYFWVRTTQKMPLMMLAFSFAGFYFFKKRHYQQMLFLFIAIATILSLGVIIVFFVNYDTYIQFEDHGRYVPTPMNHIRFSLAVAFACSAAVYFAIQKHQTKIIRLICLVISLFLFGFLHFFSVRSGLLAIYLTVFAWIIYYIIQSKNKWIAVLMLGGMLVLPFIAYKTVKPLNTRINFMIYDIKNFKDNPDLYNFSDAKRIGSLLAGCSAYQQNWLVGYGIGDIFEGMDKGYDKILPHVLPNSRVMPHNQFIVVAVGLGTIGLLLFLYLLYVTLSFNKRFKHPLVWTFAIIMFSSFLTEPTLEAQLGVGLYCITGLLSLSYAQAEANENLSSHHNL